MTKALFFDLQVIEYEKVYTLQKRLANLVAERSFQQTLLLLEHLPVYTIGKSGSERDLPQGIHVLPVDRGGDITYHGPGQLVGYPILHLGSRRVSHYIRTLEKSLILLLKKYSIEAYIKEGFPGVWVGKEKIASVGVRVKRNVSYHGFALNVTTDLKAFQVIRPCGLDVTVTSVQKLLKRKIPIQQVKRDYCEAFEKCFNMSLIEGDIAVLNHIQNLYVSC
jgi:lipoyl(octanoyl) transferase